VCRFKHIEQLRNIGIINSTTRSHLVGYFYKIYIKMHGSMNIKYSKWMFRGVFLRAFAFGRAGYWEVKYG
jgi:hypothetical protein